MLTRDHKSRLFFIIFAGRVNMHERTGCGVCETELDCVDACDTVCCSCDWHEKTRHLDQSKIEINTRAKTRAENNRKFPDKKVCIY